MYNVFMGCGLNAVYTCKQSPAYALEAPVLIYISLPLMNSFDKTEPSIVQRRFHFFKMTTELV